VLNFINQFVPLRLIVNRLDVGDVNFGCEEWKRSSRLPLLLSRAPRLLSRQRSDKCFSAEQIFDEVDNQCRPLSRNLRAWRATTHV